MLSNIVIAQSFGPGNLVVYRVGDGAAVLGSTATAVFIDEYTTTGTLVQSIPMPTTVVGANKRLTASGSATSEGLLTRSTDKRYLLLTGYDAALATAAVAGTTSASVNRVVGRIDLTSMVDVTTALSDFASAGNPRSVASVNGTDLWVTGSNSGTRYATLSSTSSVQVSAAPVNLRQVNIFNDQLYVTSSTTGYYGISSVGTGLPVTVGQTTTILPGFPTLSGPSSYGFSIKPVTGDVAYVADDRTLALGGGIQKWTLSAGTWTLAYTLASGITVGTRGLTVEWSGPNPVIYATTTNNLIVKVTDVDNSSAFTTLVTAGTNTAFRGIAFTPEASLVPIKLSVFTAQKIGNGTKLNWTTEQETNSKEFAVDRSTDGGRTWTTISVVPAAGNSSSKRQYNIVDNSPAKGVNLYRLRSLDIDGKFSNSETRAVLFSNSDVVLITPNPASNFLNVYMSKNNNSISQIIVSDINGKVMERISTAEQSYRIDVNRYSKGIYVIKIIGTENTSTQKVIVQ